MKRMLRILPALGLALAATMPALAGPAETQDRTLSPYFLVKSDDPTTDRLPLLSTSASVDIAGVIADVRVTQVYKNSGRRPIEAIYTFPASTRAAVYAMKMTIGERTITADIQERERARQTYNQAKQQGQSASLLEQERPNVFQMNVANIMPGDTIRVEMSYTELLVPAEGVYEFDYPTVVGPRYSNEPEQSAPENDQWVKSPYTHEGEAPAYGFDIGVNLDAGLPIQDISTPSHKTSINFDGPNNAVVALDPSERAGGNRDFVLRYRLAGGRIQSGLLLYQGAGVVVRPGLLTETRVDENFFLAMIQPPKRVELSEIPPREYIFIVDVSGSMSGFPLDISKTLLRNLISGLRPTDYFNVLLFSGGNSVLSEKSLPATKENIDRAVDLIDNQQGGGGTELLPALRRALALPRAEGTSRSVVIATDGYVSVETQAFDLIRSNLGKANFFAFGIGTAVNRYLMEGMARVGMGEPFIVEKPEAAAAQAEKFRKYVQSPVLTGIKVEFAGFDAYDVEPLTVPDVLADRPIIVFGKWRGRAAGEIRLSGESGSGDYRQTLDVTQSPPRKTNAALRYLWARHRVQLLGDYNNIAEDSARIREITDLGLRYNLLTAYTSFVAVDRRVRNKGGQVEVVKQPLPLPQGVSDLAVGGSGVGMGRAAYGACCKSMPCAGTTSLNEELSTPGDQAQHSALPVSSAPAIETLEVRGPETDAAVRPVLEANLGTIAQQFPSPLPVGVTTGRIVIEFTIGRGGAVRAVVTRSSQLASDAANGIVAMLRGLSFAPAAQDTRVRLVVRFGP